MPAIFIRAPEDVRSNDQRGGDEDIPGVEEGQSADDQRGK